MQNERTWENLGTKIPHLHVFRDLKYGVVGMEFKKYCDIRISTLEFVKKRTFNQYSKFGFAIGSSFPEELGSGFSKDLDPGSSPLNKVR